MWGIRFGIEARGGSGMDLGVKEGAAIVVVEVGGGCCIVGERIIVVGGISDVDGAGLELVIFC